MDLKNTYVMYHLYLPGGGLWGIMPAVQCAFIEEATGRPVSDFFDSVEGASIGSVLATGMMIPDPENPGRPLHSCKSIAQGFFNCGRRLFPQSTGTILARQIAGRVSHMLTGRNLVGNAYFEHMVLRETLSSFYGAVPFSQAVKTLFVPARNMTAQETHYFGKVDETVFDAKGMRIIPQLDGDTPMLDGAMCSTAVPVLFRPYFLERLNAHFEDYAPFVTPLTVYRELHRMAEIRQRSLRKEFRLAAASSGVPLVPYAPPENVTGDTPKNVFARAVAALGRMVRPQGDISFEAWKPLAADAVADVPAPQPPKTLANTTHVAMRIVHMGTGEQVRSYDAGMTDLALKVLHTIDAASQQTESTGMAHLEADYGGRVRAVTGKPLVTTFNRRITPMNDEERARYPNASFLDGSDENLFRIYAFAKDYVLANLDQTRDLIVEITAEKAARGEFSDDEAARITSAMRKLEADTACVMLDDIIVHKGNYRDVLATPPCDVEAAIKKTSNENQIQTGQDNHAPWAGIRRMLTFAPRPRNA